MNTYERIKELAKAEQISISELERTLKLSNGSLSKWATAKPNSKYLEIVADHFNVTTDFLLGRDQPKSKTSDPVSYYRIDTNGLSPDDVDDLKRQLDDYTQFLKSKLRRKEEDDH